MTAGKTRKISGPKTQPCGIPHNGQNNARNCIEWKVMNPAESHQANDWHFLAWAALQVMEYCGEQWTTGGRGRGQTAEHPSPRVYGGGGGN